MWSPWWPFCPAIRKNPKSGRQPALRDGEERNSNRARPSWKLPGWAENRRDKDNTRSQCPACPPPGSPQRPGPTRAVFSAASLCGRAARTGGAAAKPHHWAAPGRSERLGGDGKCVRAPQHSRCPTSALYRDGSVYPAASAPVARPPQLWLPRPWPSGCPAAWVPRAPRADVPAALLLPSLSICTLTATSPNWPQRWVRHISPERCKKWK